MFEKTFKNIDGVLWNPDGSPMSAQEFLENLYGELPALFTNEAELRELWSAPDTRRKLLEGLVEKGFGTEQLAGLARIIDAEKSDIFDVLAYIAVASPPVSREERVESHGTRIFKLYEDNQQAFLRFVLEQYVKSGVGALDDQILPEPIGLKYHTPHDAKAELGEMRAIRELFIGSKKYLYEAGHVA